MKKGIGFYDEVLIRRPLNNYHKTTIPITEAFAMQDYIPAGFTSYTSTALYTGYGVRNDAVYLYLRDEHTDYFRELFESDSTNGIKAVIYRPDRDAFQDTVEKEGIRVVSAAQTLLDLAEMGYSVMDLTKAMVLMYDTICPNGPV
jgi:hypothetical protein